MWITQVPALWLVCDRAMKKPEFATARARLYPSTYNKISKIARRKRTTLAQVISEKFESQNRSSTKT
jgi:hypothetical protein